MADDDLFPSFTDTIAEIAAREIDSIAARAYARAAIHWAQNAETPTRYSKSDVRSQTEAAKTIGDGFDSTEECKQMAVAFENLSSLALWRAQPDFDAARQKEWHGVLDGWQKYIANQVQKNLLPKSCLTDFNAALAIATVKAPLKKWVKIAERRKTGWGMEAS